MLVNAKGEPCRWWQADGFEILPVSRGRRCISESGLAVLRAFRGQSEGPVALRDDGDSWPGTPFFRAYLGMPLGGVTQSH